MSNPKCYWYGIVKKMVYRYPRLNTASDQERKFLEAIEEALDQVRAEDNGADKIQAIQLVCFEKRYTLDGAAYKMHYGRNTIQRWITKFINTVGKKAGF